MKKSVLESAHSVHSVQHIRSIINNNETVFLAHQPTGALLTRMLAINVSIPNLTVARLEQFPSPQMTDNKPSFT